MTDKEFIEGWNHFCNNINFGDSVMDAESIRFMNEMPSYIAASLRQTANTEPIPTKKGDRYHKQHTPYPTKSR